MKILLLFVLLFLPFRASASDANMDVLPGLEALKTDTPAGEAALQRPDAQKIMSEISEILHLSSKQEDRISRAVNKKTREFDGNMDDYEENSAQEKKWRFKMNENLAAMKKINEDMPDVVRDFLDDEQRQAYDDFLAARNKPVPAEAVAPADGENDGPAARPAKKRKLIRRKKGPAPAAVEAGQEEAGGVMVDKDTSGAKPAKKRRLVKRKKAAAAPAVPAAAQESAPAQEQEPAGAMPTGKEAPAEEEDAGAYP
ncbi:MAG TPA: hypothetical protein DCZ92_02755 [Elusimicrobia bacterium]|nr:MAG: hypothetical protein A2016_09225 [Elusimicrobia bacterium GWF2_62_30]HBA59744.1 hypothetical protein [Elusimicrobiota bacterium]